MQTWLRASESDHSSSICWLAVTVLTLAVSDTFNPQVLCEQHASAILLCACFPLVALLSLSVHEPAHYRKNSEAQPCQGQPGWRALADLDAQLVSCVYVRTALVPQQSNCVKIDHCQARHDQAAAPLACSLTSSAPTDC